MKVIRFSHLDELRAHRDVWDDMNGGVPFRCWGWLTTWWRHYAALGQLYVLGVFEGGHLVGIAPWYRTASFQHGRALRWLGDVEVCSEYPAVLCEPGLEPAVCDALTDWLLQAKARDQWDVIDLESTDPENPAATALAERMAERDCRIHASPGQGCWRALLPTTWDDYVQQLSKGRRKKIHRMQRQYIDSGLAIWHTARSTEQLAEAQRILIDLHQRRRNTLGQRGCFESLRYREFQQEVLPHLLQESRLALHWVELEGRPVAAEYHLLGKRTVYCYQGGIAPEDAQRSPGQIATLFSFKQAIEKGYWFFDFLRGNEPYKQQWQAHLRPTIDLRIVAGRTSAQLRHGIWLAGRDVKHWVKETIGAIQRH